MVVSSKENDEDVSKVLQSLFFSAHVDVCHFCLPSPVGLHSLRYIESIASSKAKQGCKVVVVFLREYGFPFPSAISGLVDVLKDDNIIALCQKQRDRTRLSPSLYPARCSEVLQVHRAWPDVVTLAVFILDNWIANALNYMEAKEWCEMVNTSRCDVLLKVQLQLAFLRPHSVPVDDSGSSRAIRNIFHRKELETGHIATRSSQLIEIGLVSDLLTMDAFYQRERQWPLLDSSDFFSLCRARQSYEDQMVTTLEDSWHLGPSLVFASNVPAYPCVVKTSEHVGDTLVKQYPLLETILKLGDGHLLCAGGAVTNAFRATTADETNGLPSQSNVPDSDIDIFFYNISETDANLLLRDIFSDLQKQVYTLQLYRTSNALTMKVEQGYHGEGVYQFILRLYERPDMILGGFDLPCCAIGFSLMTGLVMTPLAAFNLATSSVIVDTRKRSSTFDRRLVKYANRGFRIIFPSVDPRLITDSDELEFGKALHLYRKDQSWRIFLDKNDATPLSDYDDDNLAELHPYMVYFVNLIKGARGDDVILSSESLTILLNPPAALIFDHDRLRSLYEYRAKTLKARISDFRKWFGPDLEEFLSARLSGKSQIIESITTRVVDRIAKAFDRACRPLTWRTIDPEGQYTGSFNPINESALTFYKNCKYYRPTYTGIENNVYCSLVLVFRQYFLPKDIRILILQMFLALQVAHTLTKYILV